MEGDETVVTVHEVCTEQLQLRNAILGLKRFLPLQLVLCFLELSVTARKEK
jgi:hypothetical protein